MVGLAGCGSKSLDWKTWVRHGRRYTVLQPDISITHCHCGSEGKKEVVTRHDSA